jgi:hypothetical protein
MTRSSKKKEASQVLFYDKLRNMQKSWIMKLQLVLVDSFTSHGITRSSFALEKREQNTKQNTKIRVLHNYINNHTMK